MVRGEGDSRAGGDNRLVHGFASLACWIAGRAEARPGKLGYRPDIDRLRAIAVLAVMGYHLGFRPLAGGFVGADVFFVVSGYLIGALVFADIEAKQFSFSRFYVRGMRHLFPALFVMLGVTSLLSAAAPFGISQRSSWLRSSSL